MKLDTKPTKSGVKKVKAAGGVVWRTRDDEVEILLVHRPRYDDWTFPKGKLESGERYRDAAIREVTEETGFIIELGTELDPVEYVDGNGRDKKVRYGSMTGAGGSFVANDEVDRVAWARLDQVGRRLSYEHDVHVLESFRIEVLGGARLRLPN